MATLIYECITGYSVNLLKGLRACLENMLANCALYWQCFPLSLRLM